MPCLCEGEVRRPLKHISKKSNTNVSAHHRICCCWHFFGSVWEKEKYVTSTCMPPHQAWHKHDAKLNIFFHFWMLNFGILKQDRHFYLWREMEARIKFSIRLEKVLNAKDCLSLEPFRNTKYIIFCLINGYCWKKALWNTNSFGILDDYVFSVKAPVGCKQYVDKQLKVGHSSVKHSLSPELRQTSQFSDVLRSILPQRSTGYNYCTSSAPKWKLMKTLRLSESLSLSLSLLSLNIGKLVNNYD